MRNSRRSAFLAALTAEREQLRSDLEGLQRSAITLQHELTRLDEQAQRSERRRAVSSQEAERLGKEAQRASQDQAERLYRMHLRMTEQVLSEQEPVA